MVHFDFFSVECYLFETYRVLKKGGKAYFHHSNFSEHPGEIAIHFRNFMSKNIFSHMAMAIGFEFVKSDIIDWGDVENNNFSKDLDCLTLLRKK